jgi:hypothetical protein
MTGVSAVIPRIQLSDALGKPLVKGLLYTFIAGSTTKADTFKDQALTIKNTNPIVLDETGSCVVWLDPAKSYKFDLRNRFGITQDGWPVDNVAGAATALTLAPAFDLYAKKDDLSAPTGSRLVGWIMSAAGAVFATLAQWMSWKSASPLDFMSDAMRADVLSGNPSLDHAAAIQAALASGKVVMIEHFYLTSGNQVPSGAHIIFRGKGKLKLTDGANRPILQNTNWQKTGWDGSTYGVDTNITIEGLNIDGNQANQAHTGSGPYAGEYTSGVRFFGVTNLALRKTRVFQAKTFGIWLCSIDGLTVDDMYFDQYMGGAPANQDGLHINGPARNIQITNVRGTTNDDMIALNADDGALGANVTSGTIRNVLIDGVTMIGCLNGIRVLSATSVIDQIAIRNITGTTRDVAVNCSPFGIGSGNIGTVSVDGVDVQCANGFAGADYYAVIALDGRIQNVSLRNIKKSNAADDRPTVLVTSEANIGVLSIDGMDIFSTAGAVANQQSVQVKGMVDTLSISRVNWFRDGLLPQNGSVLWINGADANKGVSNLICANWAVQRLSDVVTLTSGYLRTVSMSNVIHKGGLPGTSLLNLSSSNSTLSTAASTGMIREDLGRRIVSVGGLSNLAGASVIDTSGVSGCEATLSVAQAIGAGAYTKLALDTLAYDRLGEFDAANHRFTASQAPGSYLFEYQIQASIPAATNTTLALYRNGSLSRYLPGSQTFGADAVIGGGTRITVAAGDYFELLIFANNAITVQAGFNGTVVSFERLK